MTDYEPIELGPWCNAGREALGDVDPSRILPGDHTWRGLPFRVGDPGSPDAPCFILLEAGGPSVTVPVGRAARTVVVAHRLLDSPRPEGLGEGSVIATYAFELDGDRAIEVPIRERFEIAAVPTEWWDADVPFLAWSDTAPGLFDRSAGPWEMAGVRQTEGFAELAAGAYLWAWEHPEPDRPVVSIQLRPEAGRCLVVALTIGYADEFPFVRGPARPVRIELTDPERAAAPFDLDVDVDRGTASYPHPLPVAAATSLEDPAPGWGEPPNPGSAPAYARVAAVPSASLTIGQGGDPLGSVRWEELLDGSAVERDGLRVRIIEEGRNWVHTTVVDEASGEPVPCRVHFRSPDGVPYQPHGHPDHLNGDLASWHIDVGGDVRLGRLTYAYIDGTCQGWLPRGDVQVDVARGFEYEPLRRHVTIEPGQRELTLSIRRWTSMNARGWYSGDSHVHFLSAHGAMLEQRGEDLNVVNLLQSQWGSLFTNTEEFTGAPHASPDGPFVTYVSQENRQHLLGHLILWGLRRSVAPWCTDGPDEAELGGTLETMLSHWADACHGQGGTVVVPHLPQPNGERAALVATGRADAVEMVVLRAGAHDAYYRYLNCGYRMPLVGGTDKMDGEVPVGLYRTYAYLGDEPFDYDRWCAAVRAGRTFLSGGPILTLSVEGHGIGDVVRIPGPGTVEIEASAEGIFPMHTLQLIHDGAVVAATDHPSGSRKLELRATVEVREHGWFAVRCGGPGYFDADTYLDSWRRNRFAHTSPVYVAVGGDWWRFDADVARSMRTLTEGSLAYIAETAARHAAGSAMHHHGEDDHEAFLARPLREAIDAITRRMGDPSDPALGRG